MCDMQIVGSNLAKEDVTEIPRALGVLGSILQVFLCHVILSATSPSAAVEGLFLLYFISENFFES
jgi:hypothetical protein